MLPMGSRTALGSARTADMERPGVKTSRRTKTGPGKANIYCIGALDKAKREDG